MSGFPLREVKEDACCIDLDPSRNSSMNLARWRAVEEFASSGRRAHSRETVVVNVTPHHGGDRDTARTG
jgi:hypothetical protein